jgi:hypothetical protein
VSLLVLEMQSVVVGCEVNKVTLLIFWSQFRITFFFGNDKNFNNVSKGIIIYKSTFLVRFEDLNYITYTDIL